ncbi:MAG: LAGLIDADG family homing endonuclease, partial [Candidatus Thermoplasmatota archaeon]
MHYYSYYSKTDKKQKWRVLIYSKEFYTVFQYVRKNIETYVAGLSDDELKQFTAGLFDAEGTVTDRLVLYCGNKKLLEIIKKRLEKIGLCHLYIYNFGSIYGIQIYRKESIKKFKELIPAWKLGVYLSD